MSELHSWLSTQHHGLQTYKSLKQKLIGRASADPEHAALYRSILTSIHLTKNRYRSMSPNRFLHGYWILCVTPKTRFAEGRPTKSRRLTRSRESN